MNIRHVVDQVHIVVDRQNVYESTGVELCVGICVTVGGNVALSRASITSSCILMRPRFKVTVNDVNANGLHWNFIVPQYYYNSWLCCFKK